LIDRPGGVQEGAPVGVERLRLVRPHNDDEIIAARQLVLRKSERLAEQAFDLVGFHGGADASGHHEAQPGVGQIDRRGEHRGPPSR